ncbi:MAG: MBL fold metallo-hydrolase, partial [Proteobacteria bacterium]|nr:MBL fold metallo-hydrolase [Pseudomonadota bacterium]
AVSLYAFRGVIAQIDFAGKPEIPVSSAEKATEASKRAMSEARRLVAADDRKDFDFAERGFLATRTDPLIRNAKGGVVSNLSSYDFLKGPAPDTVNPSLWRQARILTRHGLFKVSDRIYQVRGFDISTVSFIDAGAGWIVVDPLTMVESARAAFDLLTGHLGKKPVVAVIYSHTHGDHFGGVMGVVSREQVDSGKVKVIAPDGFMEHAISENVIAGPAMVRRVRFQLGTTLPRGAEGEITSGLGPGIPDGTVSLIAPTDIINKTGQEMTIGDVKLIFQVTPGTEAPAEMNFHLPQFRAVFMAENANLTMHNLLPARGALVRDAKAWADYLTESIRLFGDKSDIMFAAHGVPRFGQKEIVDFLTKHRDAYKFLHDQSVRLMNAGLTGAEISEVLNLPEVLARQWYNRGYYGTMSHNSKAVYQRYMGWYDANPANLWPLPPEPAARRYVEAMGGAKAVTGRAKAAADQGEYRWAATLLNHVVFADPANQAARDQLADVYTQLGYQAEAGTWRNIYLTGAQELRHGVVKLPPRTINKDIMAAMTTSMLLDFAAVRVDPEKAAARPFTLNIELTDRKEQHLITVQNGVLIHEQGISDPRAGATVRLTLMDMAMTLLAKVPIGILAARGNIEMEGDKSLYPALADLIEPVDSNFAVVTP